MNASRSHLRSLPPEQVYRQLHSRPAGLNEAEVEERLAHLGPNSLERQDRLKLLRSLSHQFTNFFTLLLLAAAGICMAAHRVDAEQGMNVLGWALLAVALLNATFSFIQEFRAEKAMAALRQFLPHMVQVRREGRLVEEEATRLVPGDVVLLQEGNRVPADLRLVESHGLLADNSPLTGESIPGPLAAEGLNEDDRLDNVAFAGCSIVRGSGIGVVFATGIHTEFGKIAHLSQTIKRTSSPLEKETAHMIRILTIVACCMGGGFFLYGWLSGKPLLTNLVFMMGIIVANVPEGLLPTFTLALAMGSLRMAKKNVLVKNLNAVEALGAVHVICSDKTGTLTMNQLTLTRLVSADGARELDQAAQQQLLALALAASEVRQSETGLFGDALDVAVAQACAEHTIALSDIRDRTMHSFAFDVERRRSAGICRLHDDVIFVVKGAFEVIQPMLADAEDGGKRSAEDVMHGLASQGLRVIGVAWRKLTVAEQETLPQKEPVQEELENNLRLAGFIGIEDPVRPEVPAAVATCRKAGIDIVLITGDHPDTAMAVARRINLVDSQAAGSACMIGRELEQLSIRQLMDHLAQGVRVFARTTPEQKMKIVTALQRMDKVVAMTGDGVNDAPALKAADVGIAMGCQGTDVARESAQIILLDDNFASIVAGIEEGRTVFANIRKFTNYVLVSNGPEILPYLLYILLPVPLALNVIHILSIDLGTDIVPSMGLGQEPPSEEEMSQPPRDLTEGLLTPGLLIHSYLFLGLLEGAWSLFLFFYVLVRGGWQYGQTLFADSPLHRSATGIALSTILLMQIGNLIGRRSSHRSGLDRTLFTNTLLVAGIAIQVVFSWAILYWPPLQHILHTGPVSLPVYGLAWLGLLLIFVADYLRKRLPVFRPRPERSPVNGSPVDS